MFILSEMEDRVQIARIVPREDDSRELRLKKTLDELCGLALEKGAHACAAIECGDMPFGDGEAYTPDVPGEESSIFWPAPVFPKDSIRDAICEYRWAIAFRLDVYEEHSQEEKRNRHGVIPDRRCSVPEAMERIFRIAGSLESAAFYKGFYLSMGLAAGNCRDVFCRKEGKCQALTAGKPCRYPLRPRPSIEACGLDPEAIAEMAGWKDADGSGFLVGMVLVD